MRPQGDVVAAVAASYPAKRYPDRQLAQTSTSYGIGETDRALRIETVGIAVSVETDFLIRLS